MYELPYLSFVTFSTILIQGPDNCKHGHGYFIGLICLYVLHSFGLEYVSSLKKRDSPCKEDNEETKNLKIEVGIINTILDSNFPVLLVCIGSILILG